MGCVGPRAQWAARGQAVTTGASWQSLLVRLGGVQTGHPHRALNQQGADTGATLPQAPSMMVSVLVVSAAGSQPAGAARLPIELRSGQCSYSLDLLRPGEPDPPLHHASVAVQQHRKREPEVVVPLA